MPDDELFQLAENKRLFDPTILQTQIERMLHDDKAQAAQPQLCSTVAESSQPD